MFGFKKKTNEQEMVRNQISHLTNIYLGLARHLKLEAKDFLTLASDRKANDDYNFEIVRLDCINRGDTKGLELISELKKCSDEMKEEILKAVETI
jgi:hypothetical protein